MTAQPHTAHPAHEDCTLRGALQSPGVTPSLGEKVTFALKGWSSTAQQLQAPSHHGSACPGGTDCLFFIPFFFLQPRSSSPDLHRGVIFRHCRWEAGAKKSLDQAAGKQSLARQEGARGWIRGALPACSHRGSFLCHTSLASQKQPPKGKTLARLPMHARTVEGPGAELGAGQEKAELAVGEEELPRASHETPARGDVPCRGHTSHWLLSLPTAGGSSGRMELRREADRLGEGLRCCSTWGRCCKEKIRGV